MKFNSFQLFASIQFLLGIFSEQQKAKNQTIYEKLYPNFS